MREVLFSVACSVAVSVLLKLSPRWQIDLRQAIGGSYLVATALVIFVMHPSPALLLQPISGPAWPVLIALGILLPSLFLVLATSVEHTGIVITDAAQRLSLLISLIAAFTLFGEVWTAQKGIGIGIGLVAIACIVTKRGSGGEAAAGGTRHRARGGSWYWPVIVFFGTALIDVLFKRMAQLTGVPFGDMLLATFVLAFAISVLHLAVLYVRGRARWAWRHAGMAVAIGLFNFGNIVFYVEAHRHLARSPALVFSTMNIGVIVLSAIIGLWFFGERLSRFNRGGLVLAVAAVAVLALA